MSEVELRKYAGCMAECCCSTRSADAEVLFPVEINQSFKNPSDAGCSSASIAKRFVDICLVRQASRASLNSNSECS